LNQACQQWRHLSLFINLQRATHQQMPVSIVHNVYTAGDLNKLADQAERFMWPGFLAKLRESFSLDPVLGTQDSVLAPAPVVSTLYTAAMYNGLTIKAAAMHSTWSSCRRIEEAEAGH
jgi:hypothetical protein